MLCALAVGIASVGVPLPDTVKKDLREWFPCMNCGCGCVNAETCWRKCCCYSVAEKLAWARENGVTPPQYLVAMADEQAVTSATPDLSRLKPCCRARVLASLETSGKKTGRATWDPSAESSAATRHRTEVASPNRSTDPGIIALRALQCRGHWMSIGLLPPSIPAQRARFPEFCPAQCGRLVLLDQSYEGMRHAPDPPPPRLPV